MSATNRRPIFGKENVKNVDVNRRAKAAPDFRQLHKQWDEKLQKGKAIKKKPLTSVQPFQLHMPNVDANPKADSMNTSKTTKVASSRNPVKSGIPRLSRGPRVSDISKSMLSNHAIKPGVANVEVTKSATKQRLPFPERSPCVKKTNPKQDLNLEFECDANALDSIMNEEGISVISTTPSRLSTKFGPQRTRKSMTKKERVAPFEKPAYPRNRFSERGTVNPANQEVANEAKKRWSIYNREQFSTKVDLMTWLKQLAEEPKTTANTLLSNNTSSVTVTASVTNSDTSIISLSNVLSAMRDDGSTSASLGSASNSTVSITMEDPVKKPDFRHSLPAKKQDSIPQAKSESNNANQFTQQSYVMGIEEKSKSKGFDSSNTGFQELAGDVHEEPQTLDRRCSTVLTPDNVRPKTSVTKSILKKGTLASIKEFCPAEGMMEVNEVQVVSKTKTKSPLRSTPVKSSRKGTLSSIKEVCPWECNMEVGEAQVVDKTKVMTPVRGTPTRTSKSNMLLPTRSASKNTPSRTANPLRQPFSPASTLRQPFSPGRRLSGTPSRAKNQILHPMRCSPATPRQEFTIEVKSTEITRVNFTNGNGTIEESESVSSPMEVLKVPQETSTIKKVRWNTELTYLSPGDSVFKSKLDCGVSTDDHSCAVRLFTDEIVDNSILNDTDVFPLVMKTTAGSLLPCNNDNGPSFKSTNNSTANVSSQTDIVSKALPTVDINSFMKNNITTSSNLPTKTAISHQIKCVIPAEQPLEKSAISDGANKNLKGSIDLSTGFITSSHSHLSDDIAKRRLNNVDQESTSSVSENLKSSINLSASIVASLPQNVSGNIGNRLLNHLDKQSSSSPVYHAGPSSLTITTSASSLASKVHNSQYQRNKAKKKKRISILERIYGDAITFCDLSPTDEKPRGEARRGEGCSAPKCTDNENETNSTANPVITCAPDENVYPSSPNIIASGHVEIEKAEVDTNESVSVQKLCHSVEQNPLQLMEEDKPRGNPSPDSSNKNERGFNMLAHTSENNANQLSSQFSLLRNLTSIGKSSTERNPSTFVTYSKNSCNILYGDFTASSLSKPEVFQPNSNINTSATCNATQLSPKVQINSPNSTIDAAQSSPKVQINSPNSTLDAAQLSPKVQINSPNSTLNATQLTPKFQMNSPNSTLNATQVTPKFQINSPNSTLNATQVTPKFQMNSPNSTLNATQVTPKFQMNSPNSTLNATQLTPKSNAKYLGGVTVLTPKSNKGCTSYNAFIVSPCVNNKENYTPESLTPLFGSPCSTNEDKPSIIPFNMSTAKTPTAPSSKTTDSCSPDILSESCSRSAKLAHYVSSLLLKSPVNSLGCESAYFPRRTGLEERLFKESNQNSPNNHLDDTNISDEGCSVLNESEMCMVFSTPFKQGLRNHIIDTNNIFNSSISAFRRVPPTCNVFPKCMPPVKSNKSDEMLALCSIMPPSPSSLQSMKVEDAEIALHYQLNEITSRFIEEADVLRNGAQNPLSIILTSGDEMHFVPIDTEEM